MRLQIDHDGNVIKCRVCGEPLRGRPHDDLNPCNRKRCIKRRCGPGHSPGVTANDGRS